MSLQRRGAEIVLPLAERARSETQVMGGCGAGPTALAGPLGQIDDARTQFVFAATLGLLACVAMSRGATSSEAGEAAPLRATEFVQASHVFFLVPGGWPRARGEYVVLLNNDTIVTEGWLNQLIGLANMSPAIGLVGPMSNYAAPPQLVEAVPYRAITPNPTAKSGGQARNGHAPTVRNPIDVDGLKKFATDFREQNKGNWLQTERLGGFCLMIKREALFKIGPLDPWSDLSLFDTDILSSKAREAGYTLAVCRDLFIHHFGTRMFAHGAPGEDKDKQKVGAGR